MTFYTEVQAKQMKEQSRRIIQYTGCVNGLFVHCSPPNHYDSYGYNDAGEMWEFWATRPDDYGNLVPANCFYHGSDEEQIDAATYYFLEMDIGVHITDMRRIETVMEVHEVVLVVDDYFNIYSFTKDSIKEDKIELELKKAGPWGHVKTEILKKDMAESPYYFLVW